MSDPTPSPDLFRQPLAQMTDPSTPLPDALRGIVGAAHVLTSGDLTGYEQDWRQRARGRALAVVRPASASEVAAVVRACAAHGAAIVPQGGNTGLSVGSIPDGSGTQVVLSLQRMNAVRAIDGANLAVTVEAGCILQNLQAAARDAGFLFPLSLAAEGSCTIGGNLAANAGGTQVLRYGNARELCLGLEVVTPQGEIWDGLSGLRKDNTGYDLRDLFIGSEGTLGVITAATLKLYPLPAATLTAWAAVPSMQAAVDLLGLAHQHLGAGLTGLEVMGAFALGLVNKHYPQLRSPLSGYTPWHVLLENSDHESEAHARAQLERLLQAALDAGCVSDAVVAQSMAQDGSLWHIRESIPLAQAVEGLNIKHDISLPVSRIPAFVAETDELLARAIPGVRLVNFGHLGDGNLHYNVQAPEGADAARFLRDEEARVNTLVFDAVARHHGSISAEHGIGSLKAGTLPRYKSAVALKLMRAIKQALDPQGIMNPGRVLVER
jgi:FAD/FMN-containing dehydrogenase